MSEPTDKNRYRGLVELLRDDAEFNSVRPGTQPHAFDLFGTAVLERRAADRLETLEAALSELWTLRMMRMSCSVMTSRQSSEHATRMDAAWQEVERMVGETLKEPS